MSTKNKIDMIHAQLKRGERFIHPKHKAYEFVRERIQYPETHSIHEYQSKHFATRDGYTLALRCTDNWFGSLVHESDLSFINLPRSKK